MSTLKKGVRPLAILLLILSASCALLFLRVHGTAAAGAVGTNPNEAKNIDDGQATVTNALSAGSSTNGGAGGLSLQPGERGQSKGLFGNSVTAGETSQSFLMLPGGFAYEGDVRLNQPDGQGTMTGVNGTHQWGEFRNGESYRLTGTWVSANGTREEGIWNLDGTKSGGTITWKDGRVYQGEWKLVSGAPEVPHGTGIMTWPDGRVYVGQFYNGKREGQGKMTWPNGKVEEGSWKQDEFVGSSRP